MPKLPGLQTFSPHKIPDAPDFSAQPSEPPSMSAPFYSNAEYTGCSAAFDAPVDLTDFERAAETVRSCVDVGGGAGAMKLASRGLKGVLTLERGGLYGRAKAAGEKGTAQAVLALNQAEERIFAIALRPEAAELRTLAQNALMERYKGIHTTFFHVLTGGKIVVESRLLHDPSKIFVEVFSPDGIKVVAQRRLSLARSDAKAADPPEANVSELRRALPALERQLF